jgi:hypothetical protein
LRQTGLEEIIHRRDIEEETVPGRQEVAMSERSPSQSMTEEMEQLADEKVR